MDHLRKTTLAFLKLLYYKPFVAIQKYEPLVFILSYTRI